MKLAIALSACVVGVLASGCARQPGALVRFGRLTSPVLLGPVDRIGGGAPLPSEKVDEFDYAGVRAAGSYSTEDRYTRTTYTTQIWSQEAAAGQAVNQATGRDASLDIRITDIEAYNWANLAAAVQKVFIKGHVVRVEGGR